MATAGQKAPSMDLSTWPDMPQKDLLETGPTLRVLRAAVDTLLDGSPPDLAAALRSELPDPLRSAVEGHVEGAPRDVGEFLERFRARAGLEGRDQLHTAQVAVELLGQMLSPETATALRTALPGRFSILFERRSS